MMTNDEMRARLLPLEQVNYMLARLFEWAIFTGVAQGYEFDFRMQKLEEVLNCVEFRRKIDAQFIVITDHGMIFGPYEEAEAKLVAAEYGVQPTVLEWSPVPK